MSWLSNLTGIHIKIRLGKSEKAKLQKAFDREKPRIVSAIGVAEASVLSISIDPESVERTLRRTLHARVDDLKLPAYAAVPVSMLIDSVDMGAAGWTASQQQLRSRVQAEAERLREQVRGARV